MHEYSLYFDTFLSTKFGRFLLSKAEIIRKQNIYKCLYILLESQIMLKIAKGMYFSTVRILFVKILRAFVLQISNFHFFFKYRYIE